MKGISELGYKLERLIPSQWRDYKRIRLEALQTHPEFFGSSYVKESTYAFEHWMTLLEDKNRALFALRHGEQLVGLTGVAVKKEDLEKALFYSTFIRAEHRGKGLSALFYQARIDWARQMGCRAIVVSHRTGNDASEAANRRFGFLYMDAEETLWPDGERAEELRYVLEL